MWRKYNANPNGNRVGDCTVRAISEFLGREWDEIYIGICLMGLALRDMPSSDAVWGAYLRRNGATRRVIPSELPEDYTVAEFCRDNASGRYLLAIPGHLVCVIDGHYIDSWDSGAEIPVYFWEMR